MEKKQIHFFGCSFTAGQELPDKDILPWINECNNSEEYYRRFNNEVTKDLETYVIECKKLAYPSIISSLDKNYECTNHAMFGSSFKFEMYKVIELIEKKETQIDCIVFQIPHFTRELILNNDNELKNYLLTEVNELQSYLKSKIASHSPEHWYFHGHLELLTFQGYLESKKIPFIFLQLDDANNTFIFNLQEFLTSFAKIYKMSKYIEYEYLIGRHYNQITHTRIAKHVKNLVDAKLFR